MNDRPKIAVCLEYPLHQHGGVEVLVRELLPGLAKKFEIHLVSADFTGSLETSPLRSCWHDHFSWPTSSANRRSGEKLMRWLQSSNVSLVHFHFGGTYQWRSRSFWHCPIPLIANAGIPCVSTNHGAFSIFECVGPQKPLWFKLAALPLFWPAKLFQVAHVEWEATVSLHDLKAVRRRFFPVRKRFIQIYHSKLDGCRSLQTEKKKMILCLGTVGPRKGQPYLAEAFGQIAAKCPDWKLVIAGRHADAETSRQLSEAVLRHKAEKQVEIIPEVSDEQADDLLNAAAIFAFPSTHEGLGLALQEAMFAGAACVGSRAGGITDLIEHEKTGLLVPPADVESLSQALERLMTDPSLRGALSHAGRESIITKGMTLDRMVDRHLELYQKVIVGGDPAPQVGRHI